MEQILTEHEIVSPVQAFKRDLVPFIRSPALVD